LPVLVTKLGPANFKKVAEKLIELVIILNLPEIKVYRYAGNLPLEEMRNHYFKGIVSRDWKGLQMFSLNRFEV
jgi:hypothetical protein